MVVAVAVAEVPVGWAQCVVILAALAVLADLADLAVLAVLADLAALACLVDLELILALVQPFLDQLSMKS